MTDPFLQSYAGQTTDQLLALEGAYRIDSLVLAFEEGLQRKERLSDEESVVLAVEALEREVNNGGYVQYFTNSYGAYGEFYQIIENALRAIGCPKTADMTRDALAALPINGDLRTETVGRAASTADDNAKEVLAACDDRYFSNDEAIADRLFAWIKANKSAIRVGDA
jgi:hypothetical protein